MSNASGESNVKEMIRFIIVLCSWLVTVLKPDSEGGFFTALFLASITTAYEYVIIYMETYYKTKRVLSIIGMTVSFIYLFLAFAGLFEIINLDVKSYQFVMGEKFPVPNPSEINWSYYWTIPWMFILPFLAFAEIFLKKERVPSSRKSTAHSA